MHIITGSICWIRRKWSR